jgi:hypothetical protein
MKLLPVDGTHPLVRQRVLIARQERLAADLFRQRDLGGARAARTTLLHMMNKLELLELTFQQQQMHVHGALEELAA